MPSNKTPGTVWLRGRSEDALRLLAFWPLWLLLALLLGGLVLAYQSPRAYRVQVGTPSDQAYVTNFHARLDDAGRPFRWSDVYGYVGFPGLGGSRPFTMQVTLDPARTADVTLIVNGETLFRKALQPGWQTITLRVDAGHPAALASRDTVLEVRAPDYRTPDSPTEPKGVKLSDVRLTEDASGGFIIPPVARLADLAAAAVLVYLFVGLGLARLATTGRSRMWALVLTALFAGAILGLEWLDRVAVSAASLHLAVTAASMILLLVATEGLARVRNVLLASARLLGVLVGVAFGLRFGGMALPQSVIIDMPWHMKWLRTLLSGDWQSLYFPGGLSSVPAEWGLNLLIPKSPLFYFAAAPLGLLPLDLETVVKWAVCLIDASLVPVVFWLALRVSASRRAALAAAALYAVMPLAFRAFSYGILPTIFAQWLATLVFAWFLGMWGRKVSLLEIAGFTLLLCLALLAFPTVAVFVSMVLLACSLLYNTRTRRTRRTAAGAKPRPVPALVTASLVAAWLLAVIAYYGLYISPVAASAAALLAPKPGGGSTVKWPGGLPDLLAWTADYIVTVLPALLGAFGLALLVIRRVAPRRRNAVRIILAWAAIAPLFLLVNLRVDMIGKHLFFTMVPFAVAGGVALLSIGRRGRGWGAALASLALAAVTYQGLIFWIDRLLRASS